MWAANDVSDNPSDSFLRLKMERNEWLKYKMEVSLFYLTTPISNLPPILYPAYGRLAAWAAFIQWVSWQLSRKITVPKLSIGKQQNLKALSLSLPPTLSHLWSPHADLSHLSCSQATTCLWMHNLHLCVGDWPAHWFVFDGSFDHMRDCGWSLCHSKTYGRMQNSVVHIVLDWREQLWPPH
jgi:hypothetical protein